MVEDESSTGYEQGAALEGRDKGSILHIEADNRGSFATILNFDTYSPPFKAEGQRKGQQRDTQNKNKYKNKYRVLRKEKSF